MPASGLEWTALGAGTLVALGLLFGGHYYWMPPRRKLHAPWTYVYGVGVCLFALVVICALTGAWTVPIFSVFVVFAGAGAPVLLFYHHDDNIDTAHIVADLQAENELLQRQLMEANGGTDI